MKIKFTHLFLQTHQRSNHNEQSEELFFDLASLRNDLSSLGQLLDVLETRAEERIHVMDDLRRKARQSLEKSDITYTPHHQTQQQKQIQTPKSPFQQINQEETSLQRKSPSSSQQTTTTTTSFVKTTTTPTNTQFGQFQFPTFHSDVNGIIIFLFYVC